MTHLRDVLDTDLLDAMLEQRYVRRRRHPQGELSIYNYTPLAMFEQKWNEVTRACRGLVVHDSGRVVARPFVKFFNLSEHPEAELPSGPVQVTDKLDGSLGVIYRGQDGKYSVATRGSFESAQAAHATEVLNSRYSTLNLPDNWTFLVEIVYPGNRVVVDYQDLDDLVLLGAVDIASGRSVSLDAATAHWPGPAVERLPYRSWQEAVQAPARPGAEGMVVHFLDQDLRVKVKQEDYVRLHRLVTGVSERRIWEVLSAGESLESWLQGVPDEFFSFVSDTRDRLERQFRVLEEEIDSRFAALQLRLAGAPRKEYAEAILAQSDWPLHRALFCRLDGKDVSDLVWRHLRPAEHDPAWSRSEDCS